jgi:hypothetical protein
MHRIDDPTAVPTLPAPRPAGTPGFFTGGAPGAGGFLATVVRYEFMNSLQEELAYVVEQSGLSLLKTDNTQLLQALRKIFINRTVVTGNMTIYVNAGTGNDGNDGLTPATALQTMAGAINAVYRRYDWNGFSCVIQLADGTYPFTTAASTQAYFPGTPFGMLPFALTLRGNPSQPQNVVLSAVNANCLQADRILMNVDGITFKATGGSWSLTSVQGMGLAAIRGGWIQVTNCRFDVSGGMFAIRTDAGGYIVLSGSNITITGNGQYAIFSGLGGLVYTPGATINVTGLSAVNPIFMADEGRMELGSTTWVGSATGQRYWAINCGCIQVNGAGATYLPGSVAGVVTQGGQYN